MPRWTTSVEPLSRVMSRYLPSRPTDLMERPSSSARKCLALGWRRTERPLPTETAFTLRPTTSLARSWRSVSTSGSSGIGEPPARVGRRGLLGVLLGGPDPGAAQLAGHEHLGVVAAPVVGPRRLHHVGGHTLTPVHGDLLEPALVIEVVGLGRSPLDALAEQRQHEGTGRRPPGVEVDGADQRLGGVREQRGLGAPARGL